MGKFLSCMKSGTLSEKATVKSPSKEKNDIYSVVKNYCLPRRLSADFWTLPSHSTPEDRVAKALVFLNIYLSTEVICPAIERLKKDDNYVREKKILYS